MRHPLSDAHAPPAALFGALAVALFAVVATGLARLDGGQPALAVTNPVELRELRFDDRTDGAVVVEDAGGAEVAVIPPGTNGFLRGVMRGLARERLRRGLGPEQPFRLARGADGRVFLHDPATGHQVDLQSFGPTNAQAFARLLTAGSHAP